MTGRVLVVGASGFTGRFVLRALADHGVEVAAVARGGDAARTVREFGASPVFGEVVDDVDATARLFEQAAADRMICLTSLGSGLAPALVGGALAAGLGHCTFVSTTSIFTRLEPELKEVFVRAEETIATSALAVTVLRPTMIYGAPGDRNMERLIRHLARTRVALLPDGGHALQQPVHVADLASIIAAASLAARPGLALNVPGPEPLTFREVVDQVGRGLGVRIRKVAVPVRPARALVSLQHRVLPRPVLRPSQIDRIIEDKTFDEQPVRAAFAITQRSFAAGIREEIESLRRATVSAAS